MWRPLPLSMAIACITSAVTGLGQAGAPVPALIPRPARIEPRPAGFELRESTKVIAGPGTETEAHRLAESLRAATGFKLPVESGQSGRSALVFVLDPSLRTALGDEGYRLSVGPGRVLIRAAGAAGLFYAGETFRQLLPVEVFGPAHKGIARRWVAPGIEIEDRPRLRWRGLLLDVARHYQPLEFLKKLVDLAALHKMNVLQLHLTDDQGWRMEIKKYPRLTEVGSVRAESPRPGDRNAGDGTRYGPFFYTQAQMRDLVVYARTRHVTILPEIEMPGHFLAALTAYPQFSCRGGPFAVRTRWGVEPDILCGGNDQAIAFALDILEEVVGVFPSEFIHIGGDEAPKNRWKECPKCQARIQAEGLKNEEALQGWFNQRIEAFLARNGRRLIGWDEILEGGLPARATVMSWRGMTGGLAAANSGHDVVMSPTSHCYFDYAQAEGPGEPEFIGGLITLETVYGFDPMPFGLLSPNQSHILGVQGNIWTEYIRTPADVEYFAFPRAAALAEVAWTPPAHRDFPDFRRRLSYHLKRLDQLNVHYRKLE